MPHFQTIRVVPRLPERVSSLLEIAYNLRWSWDPDSQALFQRIDPAKWEEVGHNPIRLLGETASERLEGAADDPAFTTHLERVRLSLAEHLTRPPQPEAAGLEGANIAYFSLEFGLANCIPVYSGGLGILAGDHLKSASELGLPCVAVGLHYARGYFRQYLNDDGWQQEAFAEIDYARLPVRPARRSDGRQFEVWVDLPGRAVRVVAWQIQVGRIPLYLLDTNVSENRPEDRLITDHLYGGDIETRIQQEIVLGIGGVRLLRELGLRDPICHMNEGHSAFLGLERVRLLMADHGLNFAEAREVAAASNVFTTHTPVPAGIDIFHGDLMARYFAGWEIALGIGRDEFLGLGRVHASDHGESFSMAVLGIRLSNTVNGVAKLHGEVSRDMWRGLWPSLLPAEVPIGSVTNGINHRTWLGGDLAAVYTRYLGTGWLDRPADDRSWSAFDRIPDSELWRAHERSRERLVTFVRARLGSKGKSGNGGGEVLDPEALTIGFARRFALYKRATLLFRDPERLIRLLTNRERPVQVLIAGKAHPKDEPAKGLIRTIMHMLRHPEIAKRIVFLENYDMGVASHLVQGCDVWLNTPRRPQEASGTSGMKSAVNGGLHLSVLDGWWAEAYEPGRGWAIGHAEQYGSAEEQDSVESELLYSLLEDEVVPAFYERSREGVPLAWTKMMKQSIPALGRFFNTDRMVGEYASTAYAPASRRKWDLAEGGFARAKSLAAWRAGLADRWAGVGVRGYETSASAESHLGEFVALRAQIALGQMGPDEVHVEALVGSSDGHGSVREPRRVPLALESVNGDSAVYSGSFELSTPGTLAFTVRALPCHPDLPSPLAAGRVAWA